MCLNSLIALKKKKNHKNFHWVSAEDITVYRPPANDYIALTYKVEKKTSPTQPYKNNMI